MDRRALLAILCGSSTLTASAAELKPETRSFYQTYLDATQRKLAERREFLLIDGIPGMREKVRQGELHVRERRAENEPPNGLIHHWEGAVYLAGAKVDQVLALVQNYDQHKSIYAPEVTDSQTLERKGNRFRIRLRLLTKKIVTVLLETEHRVEYRQRDARSWESVSNSVKVSEVDNTQELPPGTGRGYIWSMDSYWRFLEADGGVYVECTSVSLSRDIPFGMGRLIRPIIENFPEDSLKNVLSKTREAMRKSGAVAKLGTQTP